MELHASVPCSHDLAASTQFLDRGGYRRIAAPDAPHDLLYLKSSLPPKPRGQKDLRDLEEERRTRPGADRHFGRRCLKLELRGDRLGELQELTALWIDPGGLLGSDRCQGKPTRDPRTQRSPHLDPCFLHTLEGDFGEVHDEERALDARVPVEANGELHQGRAQVAKALCSGLHLDGEPAVAAEEVRPFRSANTPLPGESHEVKVAT